MVHWTHIVLALALAIPLPMVACTSASSQDRFTATRGPARHAVHSEQLRAIMARVGAGVTKTWPQEIEDQHEVLASRDLGTNLRRAAELTALLAKAADAIPHALGETTLTRDDRHQFLLQVQTLHRQASELGASARAREPVRMQQVLKRIESTCHRCHTQFREQAGPLFLGPPRS